MITIGRIAAAALCLGAAAPQLVAQGTQGGQGYGSTPADSTHRWMRGGRRGDHQNALFKGITLTADQKARIKAIHERYHTSMRASMDSTRRSEAQGQPDRARVRQQMRQRMEGAWTEMRGVLSPDQQKVFDQNLQQMKERMRQHMQQHMLLRTREHGQARSRPQG